METFRLILTAASIILTLTGIVITFIAKNSKNSKIANNATNLLSVIEATREFICQAEQIVNFTGTNKKEWVMTKVNQFCINNGIAYDSEVVDKVLEQLIDFSKTVNSVEKSEGEL